MKSTQEVGAFVHLLPPYSPDLQPIEAFSKVKTEMNTLEECSTYDVEVTLLTTV